MAAARAQLCSSSTATRWPAHLGQRFHPTTQSRTFVLKVRQAVWMQGCLASHQTAPNACIRICTVERRRPLLFERAAGHPCTLVGSLRGTHRPADAPLPQLDAVHRRARTGGRPRRGTRDGTPRTDRPAGRPHCRAREPRDRLYRRARGTTRRPVASAGLPGSSALRRPRTSCEPTQCPRRGSRC